MAGQENIGSIVYEVDMELAPLIQGSQSANRAIGQLEGAADRAGKTFKGLDTQLTSTARAVNEAANSSGRFKTSFQQAGYQIQDFIVQVQGGQSALVAFSQQGSQLAGAFGPGGAIVGAVIVLGSVLAGTLITALNGGKSAMEALADAAEAMDKVVTVSQNGITALSDKYANLARVNAEVATLMRNQALLEYNQAIAKIPKAISDASDSFISFKDKALSAFSGGYASIEGFNDRLSALSITTNNFDGAMRQAQSAGSAFSATTNAIGNTVGALASRLGISQQQAYELAKQLSDISKNPSPEAIQTLALRLQNMTSSSKDGQAQITALVGTLVDLAREAANAKFNVDSLKRSTDNLTDGQKNLIKQSERNLALSKLQGEARARLQAQYAAEDAGLSKDDPHTKKMQDDAAATYKNTEAQKTLKAEQKKGASQAESVAQKLEKLKQQSELVAYSTREMSREQAILTAQQSLGKGATNAQLAEAKDYAAKKWDAVNALKAQAAAEKLLPEARENASYKQDVQNLETALAAKKISQQQYNETLEQLEAAHQANLAKIRANQIVTPRQQAAGSIDPVQQLANENAQKLALIQQFEQQGVISHQNALALKNAADTQYEQQRTAAQWELLSQQSIGYDMLTSAVDAFSGNASNALTGLITGSMSAEEAMRSLGSTMLNSVINSLVQMGVEALKNFIIGQTIGAAATAAGVAQAATLTAAWTPPAVAASIATLGGAAAIGAASYGSAQVSGMALSLAGARKNGGPVTAGSMYQVGEGGLPEIYQASTGKQYMIPGDNGKVISNKDMQGGGGVVVYNNIQNYSGATVDSQATMNSDGSVTIETIVADLNNGGPISQGIVSNYNVKRKARGQG